MECRWWRVAAARPHVLRLRTTPAAARDASEATRIHTPTDYVYLRENFSPCLSSQQLRKTEKLFRISKYMTHNITLSAQSCSALDEHFTRHR